jgi:hypothetical protein
LEHPKDHGLFAVLFIRRPLGGRKPNPGFR